LRVLWRRHRFDGAALMLGILALGFPATLPLRLTPGGLATAGRLPEFLFFGVAFVLALVIARPMTRPAASASAFGYVLVLLVGAAFTGWGPPGRLPGPYLVAADARSVDEQSLGAAVWARTLLGPNNSMAADLNGSLVLGSYGQQYMVSVSNSHQDASQLFFAPDLGTAQRQIIRDAGIRYMVVDWRSIDSLPVAGFYFEHQEPGAFQHTQPIDRAALAKFDAAPGVSRVFDSGDLTIYDVSGVGDAP
jgi:hypothetical protein